LLIKSIALAFTLGLLIAQGEAINGSIYSYDKKLPIIEANISVKGSDLGTTTDEKGEFFIELDIINNIALLISMMGYQDTTIIITNNQNSSFGRIYLKPLVIELNQIHVDSHKDIYQSKSPSSISIFGNKFQKSVKGDLATTLNGESGLAVRSSGQATQRPILRGYSGDRFLITKDGFEFGVIWGGTIPYYTKGHAIDFLGKSDKHISNLKPRKTPIWDGMDGVPGHAKYDLDYSIKTLQPDWIQSFEFWDQNLAEYAKDNYVKLSYKDNEMMGCFKKDSMNIDWKKINVNGICE